MQRILREPQPQALYEFALCSKFAEQLEALAGIAMPENWSSSEDPSNLDILSSYIRHTFRRIKEEYDNLPPDKQGTKIAIVSNKFACFNTGLFTENFEPIYGFFIKNLIAAISKQWYLQGFLSRVTVTYINFKPFLIELSIFGIFPILYSITGSTYGLMLPTSLMKTRIGCPLIYETLHS